MFRFLLPANRNSSICAIVQVVFYVIFSIVLLQPLSAADLNEPYYHEVQPKKGEGILALLRRYTLNDEPCNVKAFYQINEMQTRDQLLKGKKYKLPILIYTYNGQSIRSTIGDSDMEKALRIQHFNEVMLQKGLRKKTYRKSKILWVPYHELYCNSNEQNKISPPAKSKQKNKVLTVSIFGKNETVEIKNDLLQNQVFYLISGHGGPDPGAMVLGVDNQYDLCEDEYAYDVTLRLAKKLMENGALVHVIIQDKNDGIRDAPYLDCDNDETCLGKTIPLNQLKRLQQRTLAVNKLYQQHFKRGITKQKVICIHVDSRSVHKNQDVFFYYYDKSKTGKKVATNLHSTFNKMYQKYQRGRGYHGTISSRPLYVLKNTTPPAVYVELANIKNRKDRLRLIKSSNRQALANWLYEGLIE